MSVNTLQSNSAGTYHKTMIYLHNVPLLFIKHYSTCINPGSSQTYITPAITVYISSDVITYVSGVSKVVNGIKVLHTDPPTICPLIKYFNNLK